MRKSFFVSSLMALLVIMLAACVREWQPRGAADLLQDIKNRGYILDFHRPRTTTPADALPNANEQRLAQTKCPADDADRESDGRGSMWMAISREARMQLGVETRFATPDWD